MFRNFSKIKSTLPRFLLPRLGSEKQDSQNTHPFENESSKPGNYLFRRSYVTPEVPASHLWNCDFILSPCTHGFINPHLATSLTRHDPAISHHMLSSKMEDIESKTLSINIELWRTYWSYPVKVAGWNGDGGLIDTKRCSFVRTHYLYHSEAEIDILISPKVFIRFLEQQLKITGWSARIPCHFYQNSSVRDS